MHVIHVDTTETDWIKKAKPDAIVVPAYQDTGLTDSAQAVDKLLQGALRRIVESDEFEGKPNELVCVVAPSHLDVSLVVLVGLGNSKKLTAAVAQRAIGSAAKRVATRARKSALILLDSAWRADVAAQAICGAMAGCHGQDLYRAKKDRFPFESMLVAGPTGKTVAAGVILGNAVNLTRRLVNEPPDRIYPESFADQAVSVAKENGMTIEVWDKAKLQAEKCHALLAVARGSVREPRLVRLSYRGGKKSAPVLALVGKGVTFDSGGLSLKPSDSMKAMKCDMAGAATVLGAMQAIAQRRLPIHVDGWMGLVENMPSADAYKLGDVLVARNGTTIEIHNTDAEGRLVLADVLSVAVDNGADRIIDLATLTGACLVALGTDVTGVMTNNQTWCDQVMQAANQCGEGAWQLPMFAEFDEQIRSEVADIKNTGQGRWGGAITAAKLLENFVSNKPWVHLDIAGPAFLEKPKPWIDGGGTGAMLLTLVEVARRAAKTPAQRAP